MAISTPTAAPVPNKDNEKSASWILKREMSATWQWRIETDPELAAAMGLLSHRRSQDHFVDPRSLESFDQRVNWLLNALVRVKATVDRDALDNPQDQLSYDLYVKQLSDYVHFTPLYKAYLCCVNRLEGPQTDLPLMARYLPLSSPDERFFYLRFLKAIPLQLSEVTLLLRTGLSGGYTPPQVSLDGVVEQIRGMISGGLEAFWKPIIGAFPIDEKDVELACKGVIEGPVSQAFAEFATFLETDYIPSLRTEISAAEGYPNGKEYYKACLEFHTTTTMTPEEIHQMGQDEVQRVREAMEDVAAQDGYEGRLSDYLEHLRSSPEYESESGAALCARFRDITGRIAPAMLKLFHLHTLPRMPFSIVETPAAQAPMAPAAYYLAGSADPNCPRQGIFYVNTSELPSRRTYECEALALHEAIPGHHTQGSIQGENSTLPEFRRYQEDRRYFEAPCRFPFYTAYVEGWGLHAETLGEELGLYTRPSDKMGQLSMEALRSCRLVVDTGMHALGWSREQALSFMLDNTAMGKHDAAAEVARYITWPGQATAYKTGELFLRRLKALAKTELNDRFDQRDFYDVVLQCGPIPLDTLEDLVRQYIEKIKASVCQTPMSGKDDASFFESMTFASWCKCCVVPGSCQNATK
jgi:uncharacterized protein (DUF885 family)